MKYAIRLFTLLYFVAGCIGVGYLTTANLKLTSDVSRLEAELGKMTITDPNRIYLTEIKNPDVPPEIARHLEGVWQFRCYMPPGYDFIQMSGGGNIAEEGLYHDGGYGSSSGMPKPEAVHELMTVSLQKRGEQLVIFESFGGSSGTTSWNELQSADIGALVIQQLVKSEQGPRSFDKDSILPILKVYDPERAQEKDVAGKKLRTYKGGLFVIYPKSRDNHFQQLRKGIMPADFEPKWLAEELGDE